MKWPFYKSSAPETKSNPTTVCRPPRPRPSAASYNLKKTQAISDAPPAVKVDNSPTIALPLKTVASQLPTSIFTPTLAERLEDFNLEIPTELVLPQLPKGRVTLNLGEIFNLFPADLRPINLVNSVRQQNITLPIDLIVGLIPSDAFQTRGAEAEDVDDAELEKLPALFDEEFLSKAEAAPAPEATAASSDDDDADLAEEDIFAEKTDSSLNETQRIPLPGMTEETAAAIPTPPPAESADATIPAEPTPTPTAPVAEEPSTPLPAGVPASISLKLASLVPSLPAEVFKASVPELLNQIDPQQTVNLPVAAILPTLGTGRVTLPLPTLVKAMPAELFVTPTPGSDEILVPLPLNEVIAQLPPTAFLPSADDALADEGGLQPDDEELTNVFHERTTPPPMDEPVEVQPVAAATPASEPVEEPVAEQPEPAAAPEPEVAPEPEAPVETVAEETAEPIFVPGEPTAPVVDDEAVIFAEKTEPTAPLAEPLAEETPAPVESTVEPQPQPEAAEPRVAEPSATVTEPATEPVSQQAPTEKRAAFDLNKFLVNINTCSLEDLTNISGIGKAMAQRIIAHRNQRGEFTSLEQLRTIPGIGRKTFRALAGASPTALNRALRVDDSHELTLQEVIQLTAALPGIEGCILTSADGLFLTGQLPPHLDENRLSAFAPELFKRVGRYARELSVGQVHRMTMFTDEQPVSIFQAGEIFLIVIHDTQHFSKALLRRLTRISEGIARLCRQRAVV